MRTTKFHEDFLEGTWNMIGTNCQPAFTRGRTHHDRQGHEVEFRISGAGEDDGLELEVVSGWA